MEAETVYRRIDDSDEQRRRHTCALAAVSSCIMIALAMPLLSLQLLVTRGSATHGSVWGGCDAGGSAGREWCNTSESITKRADALVRQLSNLEKASLLSNKAAPVERLGIHAYNWWCEGLHGVARAGVATSFPQVIGLSSSFNASLWHAVGHAIGLEARGLNNPIDGELYHGLTLWAPNVNLFIDARWGRGQETPGEDPFLTSAYARSFVRAMQGDEAEAGYTILGRYPY